MRANLAIILLVFFTGVFIPKSPAATLTWSGAGADSNWFTTNNWFGNVVPGAGDDALITNGVGVVVLTNGTTIQSLTISNRTLRFAVWTNYLMASNVVIRNGGNITHAANTDTNAPWVENAGVFIQCTNLTIESGGQINVNSLGYGGGSGQADGYGTGHGGFGTSVVGGGGGHGGMGGWGYGADHSAVMAMPG
jgi:hypothetical protein